MTSLGPDGGVAAALRRTNPARLAKQLRGDLDWIALKALEKERIRRYATPNTFAADVRAHLNHEPVRAGAPGAVYRAGKFVHRTAAATTAAFVILLIAFAVSMAVQAQRLARERDRVSAEARAKQQVAEFLQELFRLADPARARGHPVMARARSEASPRIVVAAEARPPGRSDGAERSRTFSVSRSALPRGCREAAFRQLCAANRSR